MIKNVHWFNLKCHENSSTAHSGASCGANLSEFPSTLISRHMAFARSVLLSIFLLRLSITAWSSQDLQGSFRLISFFLHFTICSLASSSLPLLSLPVSFVGTLSASDSSDDMYSALRTSCI